ncbi:restriction endonuclease subunit S [soil metagenome]
MIGDLKPYPAIKDSGVPWLGEVPEHWKVTRVKNLLRTVDVRSESGSEELLTVSSNRGVVPRRTANVTMFKAESYAGHKLCWPGDLVINSLWAWSRGLGVAQRHGIVSTAYGVYRPRDAGVLDPGFVHELVRSTPFSWELRVRSKGVWTSRLQLTDESFLGAPFPLPPVTEQAAIVRFLDHADRRIRRYIRAKQELIKLLEEQKQAIIHRAVTRGLDPDVRLKPSGVEWLGEVPEHWEVRRLKQVFRGIVGGSTTSSAETAFWDGDVVWVTPADISKSSRLRDSLRRITTDGLKSCSSELVPRGSIVVTSRAPVGNVAIAETDLCTNQGCKALVATLAVVNPTFGFHVLTTLKAELQSLATGTTFTEISTSRIGAVSMPLPPLREQAAIVRHLDKATASLTRAIEHAFREIDLLREYRTRLISDLVTGKLDVRVAAAGLPAEMEELPEHEAYEELPDADADQADEQEPAAELHEVEA